VKNPLKTISLYAMCLLYISAGINHFINPGFYEKIMPSWIPLHVLCIALSGICEIVLALLLLPEKTRNTAAWLIIAMLCVFLIVHVQMFLDYRLIGGMMLWIALIRIPLQFVLIWWAYAFIKNPQSKN
jgi:uncharacterized membrane protein